MSAPVPGAAEIRRVETDAEAAACYPLIRQLRPHIASPDAFIARWRRQERAGYRLAALWSDGALMGIADYRLQETLFQGVHFYVDDLVTDERARSAGHGRALIDWLKAEARRAGCARKQDRPQLLPDIENVAAENGVLDANQSCCLRETAKICSEQNIANVSDFDAVRRATMPRKS